MIVHLLGAQSLMTAEYFRLVNRLPGAAEHWFVAGRPRHPNYQLAGARAHVVHSRSPAVPRLLRRADGIVVHNLLNPLTLLFLAAQPWLLPKAAWVIWGGDLYIHRTAHESARQRLLERLRRFVMPRFGYVIPLIEADGDLARQWYGVRGTQLSASYPVAASFTVPAAPTPRPLRADRVTLLLGNSATVSNRHAEALGWLAHLAGQPLHLILPLSYGFAGHEAYGDTVAAEAVRLFGAGRVEALRDVIDPAAYLDLLGRVDVGVFNVDRQQAMGNIAQLLSDGAKVYLRRDSPLWDHFTGLGCRVFDVAELAQATLGELADQSDADRAANHRVMTARHDLARKAAQWEAVFAALREGRR
jgi:hypothetical protein